MDGRRTASVVRADPLCLHGWNLIACHFGVVGDETVEAESRHRLVRTIKEDDLVGAPPNKQLIEQGQDHRPEWTHPDLVAFPMDPHRRWIVEMNMVDCQARGLDEAIREAGRALAALEDEMIQDIEQAVLLHADETLWKEACKPLWMWIFVASDLVLHLLAHSGNSGERAGGRVQRQSDER